MKNITRQRERNSKRRIEKRLGPRNYGEQAKPIISGKNIQYEVSDRVRASGVGGIGAMHLLARRIGLVGEIDAGLHLLKAHLPYHESDHVLNIAYNILAGGSCLENIELLRNDESYLDGLGAARIPDPTTAGDFCRRFKESDVEDLMTVLNKVRKRVWSQQPSVFLEEAILDADGTLTSTKGECKEGMDISYKGTWGYGPLLISLANTREVLYLVNRSGNRPSHEGAAERFDQAITLCREGGFKKILLRGDTDFSQTQHLDRWDEAGDVRYVFGMAASKGLCGLAEDLEKREWKRLTRRPKYTAQGDPRARPENVKERIVREREYKNIRLQSEDVAEFSYRPIACKKASRIVVIRKNLTIEKGEECLFDDIRYFFYITNDWDSPAEEIVFLANDRCNQENLIEQLKNGVHAMQMPVASLVSNWAYMVMASLAWSLKAWFALLCPEGGRRAELREREKTLLLNMDFKTFVNAIMRIPCQIVRTGRRIIYRILSWNPWQAVFLRVVDILHRPLRC